MAVRNQCTAKTPQRARRLTSRDPPNPAAGRAQSPSPEAEIHCQCLRERKVMSDSADERWMRLAIELAWQCPPSATAFSVGAVIVDASGDEISRGFSREGG